MKKCREYREVRPRSSRTYEHTNTIFEKEEAMPAQHYHKPCHTILDHHVMNVVTPEQMAHKMKGRPYVRKASVGDLKNASDRKFKEQAGELQTNGIQFFWRENVQNPRLKKTTLPTTVGFLHTGYERKERVPLNEVHTKEQHRHIHRSDKVQSKPKLFVFGCCKHKQ